VVGRKGRWLIVVASMPPASRLSTRGSPAKPGSPGGKAGAGGKAAAAAAAAGAAAGAVADDDDDDDESEGEEEEESEEAQVCWGAVFTFLPLIIEITVEFAGAAMDAGICQYLGMLLLPIWSAIKSLFGIANAPPSPPAGFPPAPPPPPQIPGLVTRLSVSMFDFAEENPTTYLLIDLFAGIVVGAFFLYLKDISEFFEARAAAARQAEAGAASKQGGYQRLEEEEEEQGDGGADTAILDMESEEVKSVAQLSHDLRIAQEKSEEMECRVRLHRKSQADWVVAMRDELKALQEKRDELKRLLGDESSAETRDGQAEIGADGKAAKRKKPSRDAAARAEAKEAARGAATMMQRVLKGPLMGMVMRTVTGVMAISLYFMDIITDVQVRTCGPMGAKIRLSSCATSLLLPPTVPSPTLDCPSLPARTPSLSLSAFPQRPLLALTEDQNPS
jgi:hypothetical protein